MLVSASYWHSFHEGFVGAEVVQDLQEISRHSLDSVVKNDEPGKITGSYSATLVFGSEPTAEHIIPLWSCIRRF